MHKQIVPNHQLCSLEELWSYTCITCLVVFSVSSRRELVFSYESCILLVRTSLKVIKIIKSIRKSGDSEPWPKSQYFSEIVKICFQVHISCIFTAPTSGSDWSWAEQWSETESGYMVSHPSNLILWSRRCSSLQSQFEEAGHLNQCLLRKELENS